MNNSYPCVLYIVEEEKWVRFESLPAIENIVVKTRGTPLTAPKTTANTIVKR